MRVPLSKYGRPEVVVLPLAVLAAMVAYAAAGILFLPLWAVVSVEVFFAVVLIWVLMFFRDPERNCPTDRDFLLSPADGRITDIDMVEEKDFIGATALKIGIFLSIFDVHINRAPCNVTVERIRYKKGRYKNAMNPQSGRVNESNELDLVRADTPNDRLVVRQISGAIARRIVCAAGEGQKLTGGERFGMIKFGSRTELYVPAGENIRCLVRPGDKVKAGLTPLVKYEY